MFLPAQYAWFEPVLIATIVVLIIDLVGNSIGFGNRYLSALMSAIVLALVFGTFVYSVTGNVSMSVSTMPIQPPPLKRKSRSAKQKCLLAAAAVAAQIIAPQRNSDSNVNQFSPETKISNSNWLMPAGRRGSCAPLAATSREFYGNHVNSLSQSVFSRRDHFQSLNVYLRNERNTIPHFRERVGLVMTGTPLSSRLVRVTSPAMILYSHKPLTRANRCWNDNDLLASFNVEPEYAQILRIGLDGHDGRPGIGLSKP